MNSILKHSGRILAGLALALPLYAQEESKRGGGLTPLDPEQMDAARVPLGVEPDERDKDQSREAWLEEQRWRLLYDPAWSTVREPPQSRNPDDSEGLTPFQQNFRDALINQMRNSAGGSP